MKSNDIMKSFLLKWNNKIRPNKFSCSNEAIDLQNVCKSLVNSTLEWKITLTTWIWLSDIWVPLRCPALIIPALEIIRHLLNLWITNVEYCIYQATSFIIKENSLSFKSAKINSEIIKKYFKWYIWSYYKELEEFIKFDFDFDFDYEKLRDVSLKIEQIEWNKDLDLIIWKLVKYAEKRWKTKSSALMYAAANIICNWYINYYYPISFDLGDILIPIWWRKEKPFFNLWDTYTDKYNTNGNRKIISLIQSTWEMPTYYPYKGEDYIDLNYNLIPLSWEKIHWLIREDRDLVLSQLWIRTDYSEKIQEIIKIFK